VFPRAWEACTTIISGAHREGSSRITSDLPSNQLRSQSAPSDSAILHHTFTSTYNTRFPSHPITPSEAFQHLFSSTPSLTPATFSDLPDSSNSIANSPPHSPTQSTRALAMAASTTALEPIASTFTAPTMPARGHSTAPKFSPTQPRELRRYFEELEVLFARCQVTNDVERKKHVAIWI
jgi:hypothetical protein